MQTDRHARRPASATGSAFRFTPAVKWVLCRAAKLASESSDGFVRLEHIARALREQGQKHDILQEKTGTGTHLCADCGGFKVKLCAERCRECWPAHHASVMRKTPNEKSSGGTGDAATKHA